MRIYNEIVTIFNENTGLWETISEDSYDYTGFVMLAQGIPPNATAVSAQDTIADTQKTTAGYFTGGDGTLGGYDIHTSSLSETNKRYYFNVTQKHPTGSGATVQFSVAYGDYRGSGSNQYGDSTDNASNLIGETQAIYRQYASLLLATTEITGGFKISQQGSDGQLSTNVKDDFIYILNAKRDLFKDRVNKKLWTLALSGSSTAGVGTDILYLTDDSKTTAPTATPAGLRYNIVSGALGTAVSASTARTFGWFYPERGTMVFSGAELSASIPGGPSFGPVLHSASRAIGLLTASAGAPYISSSYDGNLTGSLSVGQVIFIDSGSGAERKTMITQILGMHTSASSTNHERHVITGSVNWTGIANSVFATGSIGNLTTNITASFSTNNGNRYSSSGFAPNLYAKNTSGSRNALRLVNCMRNIGTSNTLQMRSEEDGTQENYFCRIKAADYNFTSNQTFVSGALNKLRHTTMMGNPTTFVTGVGLYNSAGQLLAIGQLSKPLKKNFVTEATIKVKLTY